MGRVNAIGVHVRAPTTARNLSRLSQTMIEIIQDSKTITVLVMFLHHILFFDLGQVPKR